MESSLGGSCPDVPGSLVILEGTAIDLGQSAMRREAIQGALVTITLMLGLPVLRSRNAGETARLMIYVARQSRAWSSGAIARHVRRPKGKRRAQLHMLQGLAGVGPERAKRLLDEFGSVESVLTTSMEGLRAVDGIGLTTAEAIRWIVSEKQTHYGRAAAVESRARRKRSLYRERLFVMITKVTGEHLSLVK